LFQLHPRRRPWLEALLLVLFHLLRTLVAVVRVTVRRVWLSLSESYPLREVFERVLGALGQLAERPLEETGLVTGTG
jgi:hypothetical protein